MEYVITKLINNNIVFSINEYKEEIILFGKAIGFAKKAGDTVPEESVLRIFKNVNTTQFSYLSSLIENIEEVYIDIASEIVDLFESELNVVINDMMIISLSDHISNAVANKKEGIVVPLNIMQQIQGLYPREFAIAKKCLVLIENKTKVRLDDYEAGFIVLHYINCRNKEYRDDGTYVLAFADNVKEDIENYFHIKLDCNTFYFQRFLTHLNFLAARIHDNQLINSSDSDIYDVLADKNPNLMQCVNKISNTIKRQFDVSIKEEEKSYLAIHIANLLKTLNKEE